MSCESDVYAAFMDDVRWNGQARNTGYVCLCGTYFPEWSRHNTSCPRIRGRRAPSCLSCLPYPRRCRMSREVRRVPLDLFDGAKDSDLLSDLAPPSGGAG